LIRCLYRLLYSACRRLRSSSPLHAFVLSIVDH
jgi:hypothetical protein